MRTRKALFALFAALIAVPVAAAAYLGQAGLERERAMLLEQERAAMERRADDIRDAFVLKLQELYRVEQARSYAEYQSTAQTDVVLVTPLARNDPTEPVRDWFQIEPNGDLTVPWGGPADAPDDLRSLTPTLAKWLDARAPAPARNAVQWREVDALRRTQNRKPPAAGRGEGVVNASGFFFVEDFAVRRVTFEDGTRLVQGFRVDAGRVARRFLDPASPLAVVPRFDERIDRVVLVRDDDRLTPPERGPYGLPALFLRHIAPSEPDADPLLFPDGHRLAITLHPAAALAEALAEAGVRLRWTLGAVGAVVVLGLLFAWRAVQAEARLAERKTEFVSAVSHELRTPLTSIRMYADMLKEGWVNDDRAARDYFALISAESERLARLVNNVLDFSRLEKGRKSFDMRLGDPAPVLREAVETLRPYVRQKGFALDLDLPETLPACTFDRDALTQILVNLLDNAIKYGGEEGRKEIRVEASAREGRVEFRVLDRGRGVPPAERERIFEPFHRGTNTSGAGGSGLGLALVHRYAAAHLGSVAVADRDGGGAAFTVSLPAS